MNREFIKNMISLEIKNNFKDLFELKDLLKNRNSPINIQFSLVNKDISTEMPAYATSGSSGMDIKSIESVILNPSETKIIKTNLSVAVPDGYELQVRSRSGLAAKHSIFVLNGIGTIDSDFRGEIGVILHNASNKSFKIDVGDRIAQLVLSKVEKVHIILSDTLPETKRGVGGFGHTGFKNATNISSIGYDIDDENNMRHVMDDIKSKE